MPVQWSQPEPFKPRLIISIDGPERSGRTTFALTAPGPIAYIGLDPGSEGVVNKPLPDGRTPEVRQRQIHLPRIIPGQDDKQRIAAAKPAWQEIQEHFLDALKWAGTVVADTWTEAHNIARHAEPDYKTMASAMHYLIGAAAKNSRANIILIHRSKAVWGQSADGKRYKTAKVERDGFDELGYDVQMQLRSSYNVGTKEFSLRILDSRHDPALAGVDIVQPTFVDLALLALPSAPWTL